MRDVTNLRRHLSRQVDHWTNAAVRLGRLEDLAAPEAWKNLEQYLGVSLRDHLRGVVERTTRRGSALRAALAATEGERDLEAVRRELLAFRRQYLRAETTVDFYADAINTRTNPVQGALLRALDTLAQRSMAAILEPIGYEAPIALTYIDKGLGASILKAGLRLWDGGAVSPAAAIKIVRHNLDTPTSLAHEGGHQVAQIAGWNDELSRALHDNLGPSTSLAAVWAGWASEIAADAVAFVLTGYGSVLTLHDVLAGDAGFVFQVVAGDPHPMSFLRVELGVQMCRLAWGDGPWDELVQAWREMYPITSAPSDARALVAASMPMLPAVAHLTLATPMRAFRGRSLIDIASPARVSPKALADLQLRLGPALYTSSHWIWTECLRLLALTALGDSDEASRGTRPRVPSQDWMLRLGGVQQAA
jgi:hypothetical protein